jgi:hypothetical protein
MQKDKILKYLTKITHSTPFSKSAINKQLLEYLVNKTLQGEDVKEFTICEELFNNQETAVRVYVHNLRKKLDEYYQTEGQEDHLKIKIPKGKYNVDFEVHKSKKQGIKRSNYKIFVSMLIAIVAALATLRFFHDQPLYKSDIWKEILNNKKNETLIVLGDHFFFSGNAFDLSKDAIIRYFDINNQHELDSFIHVHPELRAKISNISYTYMTKHGPVCLHTILPEFRKPKNTRVITSSELTFEDIKTKNILFFGSFKSLGKLNSISLDYGLDFEKDNFNTEIKKIIPDSIEIDRSVHRQELTEFPVVLKSVRSYGNSIMMFICQNDPGNIATLNYCIDQDNLRNLDCLNSPDSFIAVFQVSSLGRTDMGIEMVACY